MPDSDDASQKQERRRTKGTQKRPDDARSTEAAEAKPPEGDEANGGDVPPTRSPRGFAAMSEEQRRALGRKGGRTAHARGTANKFTSESGREAGRVPHANGNAHQWTVEEAREAGRKGGRSTRTRSTTGKR
jgi:general stress protein YciG